MAESPGLTPEKPAISGPQSPLPYPQSKIGNPESKIQSVLIDTNALFIPLDFGVRIEEELGRLFGSCRILVPGPVLRELRRLDLPAHRKRAVAAVAGRFGVLEQRKDAKTQRRKEENETDTVILEMAVGEGAAVLTNDAGLRKRLRAAGVKVVCLRGRRRLAVV